MSTHVRRREESILPMTIYNTGFLLDRLGQDCHPLQYLRELTQNAIDAVQRTGEGGEVVWDVDWIMYDLDGVRKLCITDTGDGMTGDEMVKFINNLSSSVSAQSLSGAYGVGAKVAAATRNPSGVLYLSWKNSEGALIHLMHEDASGQYGLKQWRHSDGSYAHFLPIADDVRPELIAKHGTKVVLLGESSGADTIKAPPGVASPSRWISKYLNTRYYVFPPRVTVKAREGWEYPRTDTDRNYLRTLTGQKPYLSEHSHSSGKLQLAGAVAHWWILKDEPAITNNSGFVESAGHVAALYKNELYEPATGRAGMAQLQQFGVTFGYRYVVVYVEPAVDGDSLLTTNTSRTALLNDNEPLPWADWAAEFREKLPAELGSLVNQKASAASERDHTKAIRERLKDLLPLYKISRYRPAPGVEIVMDESRLPAASHNSTRQRRQAGGSAGNPTGIAPANVYAVFEKTASAVGKKARQEAFPKVQWVSVKDGTREYGNIEDRAASYLAEQNLLLINADFRVFKDMADHFAQEFRTVPGIGPLATDAVHAWFEQSLVETVVGVQGLVSSREWSQTEINKAISEEALTASVMQRYHTLFAVKRELGSKVGPLRSEAGG